MALSLTKQLIKAPVAINALPAINRAINVNRNFSLTSPKQFLFGKKPLNSEPEKIYIDKIKMGVPQKIPAGKVKSYEPTEIKNWLNVLLGSIAGSPCLVSTISKEGIANVAPFASCSCGCTDPPVITLSVGKSPDGSVKDTQINIDDTKEFGVSVASEWFIETACLAGTPLPHNVSEFDKFSLTKFPSSVIKAPLVAQSAVTFECKVISRTPITNKDGKETSVIYEGEIVKAHFNDEIYDNENCRFDYDKLKLVSSRGSSKYNRVNSFFDIVYPQRK